MARVRLRLRRLGRGWIGVTLGVASFFLCAAPARGAGLSLLEQSPRLTGTAYSGTAAWAADASMAYFNPAGLTLLEGGSMVVSGYVIDANLELTASTATTWGQNITGPNGSMSADGGSTVAVPQFHFAQRIAEDWVGYIGVTVPFGNDTNYPDTGVTRYVGTLSVLRSININPAVAWKPIENLSIGVGFNAQVVRARLNQKVAIPGLPINPAYDINTRVFGDDWAFGWNIGILYEITKDARVGVAYRSAVHHTLTGSVDLDVPKLPILSQQTFSGTSRVGLTAPDSLIASGFWSPLDWLDIMADFQWTQWSVLQRLSVQLEADVDLSALNFDRSVTVNESFYEGFRNAYRGTIGAQVRPAERWTIRFGSGFDGSPVHNANRTTRLPDGNRVLLSLGFGYEFLDNMFFDFGWTHFFFSDGTINERNQSPDRSHMVATVDASANVFGAQLTYNWKNLPWQDLPF